MYDYVPPVITHAPIRHVIEEKIDYKDPVYCHTKKEALAFQKLNGGYVIQDWRGGYSVIFVPAPKGKST